MRQIYIARELGVLCCFVLCAGCARTSYTASTNESFAPYKGKVLLLRNEVPGAEEIGLIRVDLLWPWLSKPGHVARWKKEAARHGANAVRWYGEGFDREGTFSCAKAYRIENPDDPRVKECLAQPYDYYHESWWEYHKALRRIKNGEKL